MNLFDFADEEARRQGVDPSLVRRVMQQESGGRANAVSPKGARGPMQLMPGTARDLGVNPDDPLDNIRGGVRYLKKQLDDFGSPHLALAAYNAGPGAVRRAGGVPQYAETKNYVGSIMGGNRQSGADIFGLDEARHEAAAGSGADIFGDAPPPVVIAPPAPAPMPAAAPQRSGGPTIAQDAMSGFLSPFQAFGHGVMQDFRNAKANLADGPPTSLGEAGRRTVEGLKQPFRLMGDAAGLLSAPVQAGVRPAARAVAERGPQMYQAPKLQMGPGGPSLSKTRALTPEESLGTAEGAINSALSAVRPANGAPRVPKAAPKNLDELFKEQRDAWDHVDASGYRFPKHEVTSTAADVRNIVNTEGASLYPKSAQIADRVEELAAAGDLTPAQANRLRSQVGEKLLGPNSDEVSVGKSIMARIDQLIDNDTSNVLKPAREAYKRYIKYKDVSDRLDDAGLNQVASGNGGNLNAARQALKPLVKKKGGQRMMNATPDEKAALQNVVRGTPGQNLLRAASAFDPFHSKLGTLLQTGLGIKTGGLSAATIPLGMAATAGEKALSAKNIQALLDLISTGGVKPGPQPYSPMPVGRLMSPAGLAGVGVTTAPLARIPAPKERAKHRR